MFNRLFGLIFIGLAIKFMDDFLDQDLDKLKGDNNLCFWIQRAILPYSLVFMMFALYFNFYETIAIFTASYSLGMVYRLKSKLPSGLTGWQETILMFSISIYMTSILNTISAYILIILLQIGDDFRDYQCDHKVGEENYIIYLGKCPAILIGVLLFLISIKWFPVKLYYFTIAVLFVYLIIFIIEKAIYKEDNIF